MAMEARRLDDEEAMLDIDAFIDDDDLPVAMPLAVVEDDVNDDENGAAILVEQDGDANNNNHNNIVNAHLVVRHNQHNRAQAPRGTSFTFGMVQDQETMCCSMLGWDGARSCQRIVDRIREHPDDAFFQDARTGRTPLLEACLRCSCFHVINAVLNVHAGRAITMDNGGNTALHLLFVGVAAHAISPHEMGRIVDKLLEDNSGIATGITNREGNTPLHMACMAPEAMVDFESFLKVLEANRSMAARVNNLNQTPLLLHCQRRRASTSVAQRLIEAYSDAVHVVDGAKGWSPLHYAAEHANFELIRLLLNYNSAAARLRATSGLETPLHVLCRRNVNERHIPALTCLLQADPTAAIAREAIKSFTPLHCVCGSARAPLAVVESILGACPQAASILDANNYLPIHHACEVGASTDVIAHLLMVHPAGAVAVTRKKDSALSLACACNKSASTVALLIRANPSALTEKNHYGFVPLHCVCGAVQPRMGIVEEIIKACPQCVGLKSHGGETAVHIASGNPGTFVGVIELLTSTICDGMLDSHQVAEPKKNQPMANKVGNTPLHHACFRGSPFEHIEMLAMSNPGWVSQANNAGYTALQILCKNARLQDRVITTFSRIGGPGVFAVVDLMGNTPLNSAIRRGVSVDSLQALIRAYPDALRMKTMYGDTPLHVACIRRVDPEIVREVALSTTEPPLLTPNTAGQTPISLAMEEFDRICKTGCSCVQSDFQPEQQRAFDVLATLVKILHYGSSYGDDLDRTGSLLRACVSLHRRDVRLDPAFIRRALHLYPEEARIMDDEGNYPLHIEASIPVEKMSLLDALNEGSCAGGCNRRLGILKLLFDLFPDACKARNHAGEFPLGLMIQNGRPWCQAFALILRTFPQALHWSVGINTTLFPRILEKISRDCGVATLHEVIASRPDIAMASPSLLPA